jgi:hypothetical protein
MKKPYYDQFGRMCMRTNNGLAYWYNLGMTQLKLKRELHKVLAPIIMPMLEFLDKTLKRICKD